jgi:hypothetical protein
MVMTLTDRPRAARNSIANTAADSRRYNMVLRTYNLARPPAAAMSKTGLSTWL